MFSGEPRRSCRGSSCRGGLGGLEPATSAFTEPRAILYTTTRVKWTPPPTGGFTEIDSREMAEIRTRQGKMFSGGWVNSQSP